MEVLLVARTSALLATTTRRSQLAARRARRRTMPSSANKPEEHAEAYGMRATKRMSETDKSLPSPPAFRISLFARWPDMDFNQQMGNTAYLGAAVDCRFSYLAENGFTVDEFRRPFGSV